MLATRDADQVVHQPRARGIGYACAKRLSKSGAAVALWDIDASALEEASASLRGARFAVVDVSDESMVRDAAAASERDIGKIDILINNAGITGPNQPTWKYGVADWRRVLDVDLTGPFLCCREFLPGMIRRKYGRIVNIASVVGKEGNPNASAYSAAKAGLISLTKSLGKELAQSDGSGSLATSPIPFLSR